MNLEPGWLTEATYVRTIDGDTQEFEIKRTFHVRVRNFNSPENSTVAGQLDEKKADQILSSADQILIFIPSNDATKLVDINSF
jgi:hypothetical protein